MCARCHSDVEAPPRPIPAAWTWHRSPEDGVIAVEPGEAGTTVLAVYLAVPFGGTHETDARYALPARVVSEQDGVWRYRLTVQKQPARGHVPYDVRVQLPAGATMARATPAPDTQEGQTLVYSITRAAGATIAVDFVAPWPGGAPRRQAMGAWGSLAPPRHTRKPRPPTVGRGFIASAASSPRALWRSPRRTGSTGCGDGAAESV